MTGGTWLAAVQNLDRAIGTATPEQQKLAAIAGVSLRGLPFVVAAARLRDAPESLCRRSLARSRGMAHLNGSKISPVPPAEDPIPAIGRGTACVGVVLPDAPPISEPEAAEA